MATIVDVTEVPAKGKKVILLFWAEWHEASVKGGTMHSVLEALASSTTSDGVLFGRVNAEEQTDITETYSVTAVPTFVLIDSTGNVVQKIEGGDDVVHVTQAVQNLLTSIDLTSVDSSVPRPSPEEQLAQRLDRLIQSSEVMLFMKGDPSAPRCGFSRQTVELLQSQKIPFATFDILTDEEVRQGLKKHSNWPTYPQLYVKGELIGGLDILKEMSEEGSLSEQLGIVASTQQEPPHVSLEDRLKKLIQRHKVMLFMKGLPSAPKCGFSRQMVEILDHYKVSYDTFNILEDEEVRQGLKKFSDWPTYPQLYVDGDLLGGLDICKEMIEGGEFETLFKDQS